ncbi:D-alanyl-D-alanine carboxypeptidase family protein [Streptomyces sp. TRM 70361]|uniref:D-alanyl-D-alanine carboxypeptidase family protein n=1 Tax=Streptomyces sp. TRM 70361 TaxID=3116553 RepID=UPI003FCDE7D6
MRPAPALDDFPRTRLSWLVVSCGSPGRAPRSRRRTAFLAASAAALAVLAVLLTVVRTSDSGGGEGTAGSVGASLSWPDQGQASVSVEGLGEQGDLGTRGAQRPVPIASVTKVMTAYVILRDHPLREGETGPLVTVDQKAANESFSGTESSVQVTQGQRLSQRQLLELMLIPSGNNIARLLARWDAGSQEAFVAKMNRAADDLGMDHTTYTGASGIEPTTTSTSEDQLKLARQAMRQEVIRSVVAMPSTTVSGVPGPLTNTNILLGTSGIIGLKTGSSTPAGGALMWAATASDRHGHRHLVLGVVLHQRSGTSPQEGLRAAFDTSRSLVEDVRQWLSTADVRPGKPPRSPSPPSAAAGRPGASQLGPDELLADGPAVEILADAGYQRLGAQTGGREITHHTASSRSTPGTGARR